MPLVKKKKDHSIPCEELLESEPMLWARQAEKSPSPGKQALDHSESFSGEKKKKRKSLPLAMSHFPDSGQGEEPTRIDKKLKKIQGKMAFILLHPGPLAGDVLYGFTVGKETMEQVTLGRKQKQGSLREHSGKVKKEKKVTRWETPFYGTQSSPGP
ncbi:hypothetical protein GW7_12551 [Heterocephalus glaber]|uniref:Uncharacterized protein n=1 Tax=Heterocephalus glaber TaxID=10181 RepID=G5C4A7_HETGA|nr:hypothetical protein GW7_12551 [Heterocephalus glaber]